MVWLGLCEHVCQQQGSSVAGVMGQQHCGVPVLALVAVGQWSLCVCVCALTGWGCGGRVCTGKHTSKLVCDECTSATRWG